MTGGPHDVPFEPASHHLVASLAPRGGRPLAKAARSVAAIAMTIFTGDVFSGPSETDLLVVRTTTGGEILRVSAGSLEEADRLLAQVREDLGTMTVTQFIAEWRAPDPD